VKATERKRYEHAFAGSLEADALERVLRAEESALAPGGAKRRVSLLYAQLQGYQAAEQTPQRVVSTVKEWLEAVTRVVQREGGRAQRVLGHGLWATFGDPLPQTEHALKAVSVGLAAQAETARLSERWAELGLTGTSCRVGVATGEVITGDVGDAAAADYATLGSTVALAETLMGKAPPGGVMVSEETRRLCLSRFEFQGVPGFPMKGHADLYQPYLAVGPKLETDPERGAARLPSNADVLVRTPAQTAPGRVDNVSAGGMHVSSVMALKVGDAVDVEFAPVPELTGAAPVIVRGRVRHLRASDDGSPGFGLLIERADSTDSDALRHFVALYFAAPPNHGDGYVTEGGDFYRLELGPHYLKLIRAGPGAG
jgi:class 3 adenylate cyclase